LTDTAIEDTTIIGWSHEFNYTIATLDQSEYINNSHFLNEAIKGPEYIIKTIDFGILNCRNQGTIKASNTVITMTKGPVLENICSCL
jgi:hypothetical protein